MNTNLKKGFLFSAIGTYSNFALQLIIQMVLSRLLTPKEYGIVAIIQVFIVFFQMMVEAGLGPAIIQNKNLNNSDYKNIFTFSGFFAIILAIFFGIFGNLLAIIYNNDIYIYLTWVQSISILFNGFQTLLFKA